MRVKLSRRLPFFIETIYNWINILYYENVLYYVKEARPVIYFVKDLPEGIIYVVWTDGNLYINQKITGEKKQETINMFNMFKKLEKEA